MPLPLRRRIFPDCVAGGRTLLGAQPDQSVTWIVGGRRHERGSPADRRLREADRRFDYHVVVLAHEHRVLFYVNDDVEIALRSAAVACLALAAQLEPRAVVHARRNFHRERFVLADSPLPLALRARVGDDHALAAALPAGG